jgi:peptidoglycan/xylan/chitin deacetylase (PgdA/CDA1 family)
MRFNWVAASVVAVAACSSAPPRPVGPPTAPARAPQPDPPGYYPGDPLPAQIVYLTFDDGPAPWTSDILDVLRDHEAKATFFVDSHGTPTSTPGYPGFAALVRRILDDGHALGNHTMTHPDLGHLPPDQIAHELDANHAEIERALGRPHRLVLIRPAFGSPWMTATEGAGVVGPVIAARGLNVLWSVNSGDALEWAHGERYEPDAGFDPAAPEYQAKVRRIESAVLDALQGQGAIVLLHDTHPTTRDALPGILRGVREKGYRTATLDEWLAWRFPGGLVR